MKRVVFFICFMFVTCLGVKAQAVFELKTIPVCWAASATIDSTLYAYWLMSSREEEPRLVSYLNVAGQKVAGVNEADLSPGLCCCGSSGSAGPAADGLAILQDSIIVLYDGADELARDTIQGLGDGNGMFSIMNQDSAWAVTRYWINNPTRGFMGDKGSFMLVDSAGGNGLFFEARAGAAGNLESYVTLGNGDNMPYLSVRGGASPNIRAGYGDSTFHFPVVSPGSIGLPQGRYVWMVDSLGNLSGNRGWVNVDSLYSESLNGIYTGSDSLLQDGLTSSLLGQTQAWRLGEPGSSSDFGVAYLELDNRRNDSGGESYFRTNIGDDYGTTGNHSTIEQYPYLIERKIYGHNSGTPRLMYRSRESTTTASNGLFQSGYTTSFSSKGNGPTTAYNNMYVSSADNQRLVELFANNNDTSQVIGFGLRPRNPTPFTFKVLLGNPTPFNTVSPFTGSPGGDGRTKFAVQQVSSASSYFDWMSITMDEDITAGIGQHNIGFYNEAYQMPNDTPSTQALAQSLAVWTGDGSGITPSIELLGQISVNNPTNGSLSTLDQTLHYRSASASASARFQT